MDQPFVVFVVLMFVLFGLGLGWGGWTTREDRTIRRRER